MCSAAMAKHLSTDSVSGRNYFGLEEDVIILRQHLETWQVHPKVGMSETQAPSFANRGQMRPQHLLCLGNRWIVLPATLG
jgi:hypothetical protein